MAVRTSEVSNDEEQASFHSIEIHYKTQSGDLAAVHTGLKA